MSRLPRLEFLDKLLANSFALSDAEDNNSGLLNRGGIADLPIHQKSREPSFLKVIDSFALPANTCFTASRTIF